MVLWNTSYYGHNEQSEQKHRFLFKLPVPSVCKANSKSGWPNIIPPLLWRLQKKIIAHNPAKERNLNLWSDGPMPVEYDIQGFHSVTPVRGWIWIDHFCFGWWIRVYKHPLQRKSVHMIYKAHSSQWRKEINGANVVDVVCIPYSQRASMGIRSVHHVAWRTPTDEQQRPYTKI